MRSDYRLFTKYVNIRVFNSETKAVYEHRKVPIEHVEMLKMNPTLEVEILSRKEFRPKKREINEENN